LTCAETVQNILKDKLEWKVVFGGSVRMNSKTILGYSHSLFRLKPDTGIFTGTHCMLYHSRAYDEIITLIDREVESGYHIDLLLCNFISPIMLSVPYLCLFASHDKSDVRLDKDTSTDFALLSEAHTLTLQFMNIWKQKETQKQKQKQEQQFETTNNNS
jgi:hypothetical protein